MALLRVMCCSLQALNSCYSTHQVGREYTTHCCQGGKLDELKKERQTLGRRQQTMLVSLQGSDTACTNLCLSQLLLGGLLGLDL